MNWFELGCELQRLGGLVKKRKKIEIWSYNFCLCPVKAVSASGAKKILISWHMKAQTSWERDRERHRHREIHRLKAGKGNIYVGFKFMKILNTAITWGFRIINKQKQELLGSLCWEPHINASHNLIMNYSILFYAFFYFSYIHSTWIFPLKLINLNYLLRAPLHSSVDYKSMKYFSL